MTAFTARDIIDLVKTIDIPVTVIALAFIFRRPLSGFIDSWAHRHTKIRAGGGSVIDIEVSNDSNDVRDGKNGLMQKDNSLVYPLEEASHLPLPYEPKKDDFSAR